MEIKQITREQMLAEIIVERDKMITTLVLENTRQAEKIKALEAQLAGRDPQKKED